MTTDVASKSRKRQRPEVEDALSVEDTGITSEQHAKKPRIEERRSLFVRSLPTNVTDDTLADFFSQHFPVKHAVVVLDQKTKASRGYGFVTLADSDDASAAKNALDKTEWDGKRIRIDIAEPRKRKAAGDTTDVTPAKRSRDESQKPPKLIIRNLPWSVRTPEHLSNLFRSYGKVKYADLPQSNGKLRGFGFVTIRGKKNAENALEGINGKEIDGRTLAVDWAVDKTTWEQNQHQRGSREDDEDPEVKSKARIVANGGSSGRDNKSANDEVGSEAAKHDGDLNADLENFMKNHMQNMEDEDDEDKDSEDETLVKAESRSRPPRTENSDISSTLFIRNVPFTATDEQLKTFFSKFGPVRYARVVIDKTTEKPAGTGFVCFSRESDARNCVREAPRQTRVSPDAKPSLLLDENADPSGQYTFEGRLLQVAKAVTKAQAENLAEISLTKRREKDKRRLYLLSEGAIGRDSPLFGLLSHSEVAMRQASAAQRKKLVQNNPSLHLSLTRLALRNIPRNMGSKELKELARKAVVGFATDVKEGRRQPLSREENARDGKDAKDKERQRKLKGKGIVRQAKIVFESVQGSKVDEKSGAGKSRGYGFIEYTSHHWALMGLRYLNGYQMQNENGKKQRLIAEFSIENANVVQRRRTAEGNSSQKASKRSEAEPTSTTDRSILQKIHIHKGQERVAKSASADEADNAVEPGGNKEMDMKQRLIARKRLMRKKKAKARGAK